MLYEVITLLSTARNVVIGDAYMRGGNYKAWGPNMLLGEDVSAGGGQLTGPDLSAHSLVERNNFV